MQVRCVCFTLNNYSEEEYENIVKFEYKYLIIGKEVGEKKETPHLQGYMEFVDRKYFSELKKLNERIHWESRRGTQLHAINYCKKEEDWKEWGEKKVQGKRNDLIYFKELALKEGMRKVVETGTYQEIKTCEVYLKYKEEQRDFKPEVIWIWGESETGKSRMAATYNDAYWKDDSKWWDGYDKHETVVIDDFTSSQMKFKPLLRLLDRYPLRVESKGATRQMLAKRIIITSIHTPYTIYQDYIKFNSLREPYKQLLRRIDKIVHLEPEESEVGVILDPTLRMELI